MPTRRFHRNHPLALLLQPARRRRRQLITEISTTLARARANAAAARAELAGDEPALDPIPLVAPGGIAKFCRQLGRPLYPWQEKVLADLMAPVTNTGAADA